jgi:hypothetical protein
MEFKLNSPPPYEVKGPQGQPTVKMVITLEDVPSGELFTIQYFAADGTINRQDKECNVRKGVTASAVAKL